mmetsp:Transcript_1140/g.3582  ORF Transcript_1140/g.3582 Transcript_1140/m.3582 type:complete len:116 (+) Transcript_1140:1334-1681(+)
MSSFTPDSQGFLKKAGYERRERSMDAMARHWDFHLAKDLTQINSTTFSPRCLRSEASGRRKELSGEEEIEEMEGRPSVCLEGNGRTAGGGYGHDALVLAREQKASRSEALRSPCR